MKPFEAYFKNKSRPDGYSQSCKSCEAAWKKNKRKTNLTYKLQMNLRSRVRKVANYAQRAGSTIELLGCSYQELRRHLESKFDERMSWENYGEWHIDHIRPCASFDLLDVEQQRLCFHYSNLQPLWAEDNYTKGSKYNGK